MWKLTTDGWYHTIPSFVSDSIVTSMWNVVPHPKRPNIFTSMSRRGVTGPCEATWHLMAFPIDERYPPVQALRVHLEDQQQVVFDEGTEEEALEKQRDTELTAFFQLNAKHRESETVDESLFPTYLDLPKKFRYDKTKKE